VAPAPASSGPTAVTLFGTVRTWRDALAQRPAGPDRSQGCAAQFSDSLMTAWTGEYPLSAVSSRVPFTAERLLFGPALRDCLALGLTASKDVADGNSLDR